MHVAIAFALFLLFCMASSTKQQRDEARERMKVPGRIVGAITLLVVLFLYFYPWPPVQH